MKVSESVRDDGRSVDGSMHKLRNDRFRNARGGRAARLMLACSRCGKDIILYQKDGKGHLLRCYFNRVMEPEDVAEYCARASGLELSRILPLSCPGCSLVIGTPMRHSDGRLAYRLRPGTFTKRIARCN